MPQMATTDDASVRDGDSSDSDAETSGDSDSDSEFEYYPQVTAHAPSAIEGEIVDTRLAVDFDSPDTSHSVGVVIKDPEVTDGWVWESRDIPEGFTTIREYNDTVEMANADVDDAYVGAGEVTQEAIDDATTRLDEAGYGFVNAEMVSGTDYKIVGEGNNTEIKEFRDEIIGVDVGGGTFDSEQSRSFNHDTVMVWYGGIIGQFLIRTLDFNGLVFANFNQDGTYLNKGILQVPDGWRNNRGKCLAEKQYPREARPIVLRPELEDTRAEIRMTWDDENGRRNYEGVFIDGEELSLRNAYDADDTYPDTTIVNALGVDEAYYAYNLYHGDGFAAVPESFEEPSDVADTATDTGSGSGDSDTSGGSFDIGAGTSGESEEGLTTMESEFVDMVVDQLAANDVSSLGASEMMFLNGTEDFSGLVYHNSDEFDTEAPSVDMMLDAVNDRL